MYKVRQCICLKDSSADGETSLALYCMLIALGMCCCDGYATTGHRYFISPYSAGLLVLQLRVEARTVMGD